MEKQLNFLREIDRLKNIVRKSPLIDQSRKENSAEHSWHLAMYALVLSDTSNAIIDTNRVIRMLLLHDIVEIDAGDHPIHETTSNNAQEELELQAAKRIFGLLPKTQSDELMELWLEFEEGKSDDAAFAKSLDRMQPLIHNIATDGGTWKEAGVTEVQVEERYGPVISGGSKSLWGHASKLVKTHFN
jgi:putative hydrolase of HD superfamily